MLHVHLNEQDDRLDDDGMVKVCCVAAEVDDNLDESDRGERLRLREALGNVLDAPREWPLSGEIPLLQTEDTDPGAAACNTPSIATKSDSASVRTSAD